jgi:hypothetical protein
MKQHSKRDLVLSEENTSAMFNFQDRQVLPHVSAGAACRRVSFVKKRKCCPATHERQNAMAAGLYCTLLCKRRDQSERLSCSTDYPKKPKIVLIPEIPE